MSAKKTTTYFESGKTKLYARDYAGAIKDFSKVIELDPEFAGIYYWRGLTKSCAKNFAAAIADLDKAIAIDPESDDISAYYYRGHAKYKLQDYIGAIADFDKVIEIHSVSVHAYYYRGAVKYKLEDYLGAIEDYTFAIDNFSESLRFLQEYPIEDKTYEAERKKGREECSTKLAKASFFRGNSRLECSNFLDAVNDYSQAIELKYDLANTYYKRAVASYIQGEYQRAIHDCNETLELKPDFINAYFMRANAKFDKGDYANSSSDFEKFIVAKSNNSSAKISNTDTENDIKQACAQACYIRAKAKEIIGDTEGAMADQDVAEHLWPEEKGKFYRSGVIYDPVFHNLPSK